jgi:hypothetical protein
MGTVALDRGPGGRGGGHNGSGGGDDGTHGDAATARSAAAGQRGRHDRARPDRNAGPDGARSRVAGHGRGYPDGCPEPRRSPGERRRAARADSGAVARAAGSAAAADGSQLPQPPQPVLRGAHGIPAELG